MFINQLWQLTNSLTFEKYFVIIDWKCYKLHDRNAYEPDQKICISASAEFITWLKFSLCNNLLSGCTGEWSDYVHRWQSKRGSFTCGGWRIGRFSRRVSHLIEHQALRAKASCSSVHERIHGILIINKCIWISKLSEFGWLKFVPNRRILYLWNNKVLIFI